MLLRELCLPFLDGSQTQKKDNNKKMTKRLWIVAVLVGILFMFPDVKNLAMVLYTMQSNDSTYTVGPGIKAYPKGISGGSPLIDGPEPLAPGFHWKNGKLIESRL
jgi:hypothetical protein